MSEGRLSMRKKRRYHGVAQWLGVAAAGTRGVGARECLACIKTHNWAERWVDGLWETNRVACQDRGRRIPMATANGDARTAKRGAED
jgi:hypothetical protein